jgi:glycosyltransferase involved in cell wall biosynthesis
VNKQILYIWDSDYPWDVRVEKICKSLVANGSEVHLAARNLKQKQEYEIIDGIHVHRLKAITNKKLNYALSFPVFFSPIWRRLLDGIINKHNIELLIVRDLPMAIAAIWAGKRHGIPVVLDMAEDYHAMIMNLWKAKTFRGLNLIVRNPYLVKAVECYVFSRVDHVLIVIDEAICVPIRNGCAAERLTVVGNTPHLSVFCHSYNQMSGDLSLIQERFSIIYTGGLQIGRGIQTVLDALPAVINEIPDVLFVIVGDGHAREQLEEIAKDRRLKNYIMWVGWVNHERIFDYIKMCKVGLIPHFVTDHVNTTIPNKLFDYMGCGIPVITSDAAPMKRILDEEKCGLTFSSGNSRELAECIIRVREDEDKVKYGINGLRAVNTKYNWKEDEKKLLLALGAMRNYQPSARVNAKS